MAYSTESKRPRPDLTQQVDHRLNRAPAALHYPIIDTHDSPKDYTHWSYMGP